MAFTFLGSLFIIIYFILGVSYKSSAKNNDTANIIYFIIWNFVEPISLQIAQFIIIYNAVRPTPNNAPFGRMMSVVRRPVSSGETTASSRNIQKNGFSPLSDNPISESSSKTSKKSKKSNKSLPEIQTQTLTAFDDQLPTPFAPYTTGWDELLTIDNLGDFFAGEIPIEQHQITHYRRDSSIDISSLASTTYFSTTQSVYSKND